LLYFFGYPQPRFSINDEESQWGVDAKQIVSYLKDKWPEGVVSESDEALTLYFYKVPGIIWVAVNGCLFSS
jgi:hypothetical protein